MVLEGQRVEVQVEELEQRVQVLILAVAVADVIVEEMEEKEDNLAVAVANQMEHILAAQVAQENLLLLIRHE